MRKILAFLLVLIILLPCISGCIMDKSYTVTVIPDYDWYNNELKESYLPGEVVTVKAPNVTENYYTFILNGIEYEETDIDDSYTYFTFTMPAENVIIEIKQNSVDIPMPPPQTPLSFSEFLDEENFVQELYLQKLLNNYYYEGIPITKQVNITHWDEENGRGYNAKGELFGFENSYYEHILEGYGNSCISFYTETKLGGLILPYDIDFSETLESVLGKIGINSNPQENFSPDEEGGNVMTLSRDEKSTITLTNCKLEPNYKPNSSPLYDYIIKYTEVYNTVNSIEENEEIARTVILYFSSGDNTFGKIHVNVNERRKAEKGYQIAILTGQEPVNKLRDVYRPGEAVFIELETLTESSYTVKVNYEKIEPYSIDEYCTRFMFEMPKGNVIVEIEENGVNIPEAPQN